MEIQCNFMSARNTYNYLREERFFLSGGHKTGTKLLQKRYSGGKSFMVLATILILNISIHTILNIEYNTEVNIEVRRVQVLFVLLGFIFRYWPADYTLPPTYFINDGREPIRVLWRPEKSVPEHTCANAKTMEHTITQNIKCLKNMKFHT